MKMEGPETSAHNPLYAIYEDGKECPETSAHNYLYATYEDGKSVPKRRHIKFRRRGIAHKKEHSNWRFVSTRTEGRTTGNSLSCYQQWTFSSFS